VVIVLGLSIVAAIAVPNFITYRNKSRVATTVGSERYIPHAVASFAADSAGNLYPDGPVAPGHVRVVRETEPALQARRGTRASFNTEAYDHITDNPFLPVTHNPLSTFAIDVDTASYAKIRRFLSEHRLPPPDAVRIEELVNYFPYIYPPPTGNDPFAVDVEVASCPWQPAHRLVRIGLKGQEVSRQDRPASNLVFLIDVSGSMQPAHKLPLVKKALTLLVAELTERDRVAIVVYAGASGLVLPPTPGHDKKAILSVLERLEAGGSTNGGAGI